MCAHACCAYRIVCYKHTYLQKMHRCRRCPTSFASTVRAHQPNAHTALVLPRAYFPYMCQSSLSLSITGTQGRAEEAAFRSSLDMRSGSSYCAPCSRRSLLQSSVHGSTCAFRVSCACRLACLSHAAMCLQVQCHRVSLSVGVGRCRAVHDERVHDKRVHSLL